MLHNDKSTHQEDTTTLYVYVPNNRALKYIKQKLIVKGKRDKQTITIGNNNISLLAINSTSRQKKKKISKNVEDLNNSINQFDLMNPYRISHPGDNRTHTIFKYTWNIHQNSYILGHKINIIFKRMKSYEVCSLIIIESI